jgi:hypothetical protein
MDSFSFIAFAGVSKVFSSEVDTGSREENTAYQGNPETVPGADSLRSGAGPASRDSARAENAATPGREAGRRENTGERPAMKGDETRRA